MSTIQMLRNELQRAGLSTIPVDIRRRIVNRAKRLRKKGIHPRSTIVAQLRRIYGN